MAAMQLRSLSGVHVHPNPSQMGSRYRTYAFSGAWQPRPLSRGASGVLPGFLRSFFGSKALGVSPLNGRPERSVTIFSWSGRREAIAAWQRKYCWRSFHATWISIARTSIKIGDFGFRGGSLEETKSGGFLPIHWAGRPLCNPSLPGAFISSGFSGEKTVDRAFWSDFVVSGAASDFSTPCNDFTQQEKLEIIIQRTG